MATYYTIKTKRRKLKTGRLLFLLALCSFLFILLFSVRFIGALNAFADQSAWAAALPQPDAGQRENILIYSVTESSREDGVVTGMLVAACDFANDDFRLVHIPVQTSLELEGHGFTQLAQVYGKGGAELVTDSVTRFFGLPIHGYLEINEAFLPTAIDKSDAELVSSQLQLTNGGDVLPIIYNDDLTYAELLERRRQILSVISTHIMEPGPLGRVQRFLEFSPLVRTNLSWRTVLSSMESVRELSYQQTAQWIELPGEDQFNVDGRLADIEAFAELLEGPPSVQTGMPRSEVSIEVLNGSGIEGRANEMAQSLQSEGFKVVHIGNADHSDYRETQVISRIENMDAARDVAILIPNAQMLKEEKADSDAYVTVIIGKNYRSD